MRACAQVRVKRTQLQYVMESVRNKILENTFTSMNQLCEFVEKNPLEVEKMTEGVPQFRDNLIAKHGEKMGVKLYETILTWYERKCDGWTSCSTMLGRQRCVFALEVVVVLILHTLAYLMCHSSRNDDVQVHVFGN